MGCSKEDFARDVIAGEAEAGKVRCAPAVRRTKMRWKVEVRLSQDGDGGEVLKFKTSRWGGAKTEVIGAQVLLLW